MKQSYIRTFIILGILAMATPGSASDQTWIKNTVSVGLSSTMSLGIAQELRFPESTQFDDTSVRSVQIAVSRKLKSGYFVAIAYQLEHEDRATFTSQEHRFLTEGGWKTTVREGLSFDVKARLALRTYRESSLQNHLRVRLRFKLTQKAALGGLSLTPFVGTELFGDTKDSTDQTPNRNRFYLGSGIRLTDRVKLTVNYMRQDTKGKEVAHVLVAGFGIKL